MAIYSSVAELIGNTPMLSLSRFAASEGVTATILAKLEAQNPAGSAKDRVALSMIEDAERRGLITVGATLIEPTSGNTGIGLAAIAASRGYRAVIVMPDTMSIERRQLMAAYGAEVVLTPGAEGMAGAIRRAEELKKEIPGAFIPAQFENPENPNAHYRTTGPEILADTEGVLDFFVAGVGTGGTITGVGRYLSEHIDGIRIVGVEPSGSPILSGGKAGAHGLQGIGAGFIPKTLDVTILNEVITITEDEAYATAKRLAATEGVLCGISGGAALAAAVKLARRDENKAARIAVLLPDTGERYLSTLYS